MTEWNLPWHGACRCGRTKLKISAPPLLTMACHCTGCQRMSGSAYSLSAAIPAEGFSVVEGEPVVAGANAEAGHHFCPHCMTWMFTRPKGIDFFVNLRPTMLEDASWFVPFIETYTSEKLPWVATPAVHSFERLPPFDAYEGLVGEFAAR